ncbi:hypothetical protein J3R30DRAFT_3733193 [Lentinula aciculospora]|uniref:DUF6535 domain-containing protein n=1 Tax=Lentinula aciculospora TaxID=153920 RepID=A0A9W9ADE7_9AGAR|nr:hypothetical protein J3R30DRAFT_3733193 [Lentinula aciculospora]
MAHFEGSEPLDDLVAVNDMEQSDPSSQPFAVPEPQIATILWNEENASCAARVDVTNDDYEQRFPVDAIFEEAGPNARVWRTYLCESAAFDENMIGEVMDVWMRSWFSCAGLFSAVVTSFLVQTTQNLQLSSSDVSASLLVELVALQRAVAAGPNVSTVPESQLTPRTPFAPSAIDICVNGL